MAVNDHSLGPVYFAQMRLEGKTAKRSWSAEIYEECKPWRRGNARAFTLLKRRALLIGWWRRYEADVDEDFKDVQWLDPKRFAAQPDEIADWYRGPEDEQPEVSEDEAQAE